jgi:transcriptional regulator with XRE-family HTH domain
MDPRASTVLGYIGANVQRLRVKRGMTQSALADAAEISTGFLQSVEKGQTNVGVVVLVRLADVLGVRLTSLFRKAVLPEAKRGRPRKTPG